MDLLRDLLLGALGGALLCLLGLRTRYAAPLAALRAERDLLRERVADLTERAHEADETAELVAPLRESLRRVEAQVHTLERERGDQFARVALELTRVQSSTEGLREQTASLVGSLSSANIRGSWGEVTLRRVLAASGLLARCDFDTQAVSYTHLHRGGRLTRSVGVVVDLIEHDAQPVGVQCPHHGAEFGDPGAAVGGLGRGCVGALRRQPMPRVVAPIERASVGGRCHTGLLLSLIHI